MWSPGEEKEFFGEGEFRGWPLRIWPIFTRPFIRLNGRCYCFDLYSLVDNIYRVMERIIVRLKPEYRENWNEIQRKISEDLHFKYLQQLPAFSANNARLHVDEKGRQTRAGARAPEGAKGQTGD